MNRSRKTHLRLTACLILGLTMGLAACGPGETPGEPVDPAPAAEPAPAIVATPAPTDAAGPPTPVPAEPVEPAEVPVAVSAPTPVVAEAAPVKAAPAASPPPPEKPAAFAACASCHSVESGGRNGIGPNLFGVMGRQVGGKAGYAYSDAMAAHGGTWTPALMDEFLAGPREAVPGTKMMGAPVRNAETRQALVAYLSSLR